MPDTKTTTLFSLATFKEHLKVVSGNTDKDALLIRIADGVSERIEDITHRKFVERTVTEYYTPDRADKLYLRSFPVSAITTLKTRWSMSDSYTTEASSDYYLESRIGVVHTHGIALPVGIPDGVELVSTQGFGDRTEVPANLLWAALEWAKFVYDRQSAGLIVASNASMGGMSVSILPQPPKDIMHVIESYKKLRL